ncbi:uncharacterized protein PODANS_2_3140 [Podospora anserina S mat+]|uniref:Podospora anserina S mat+ genomic DNA chromosome 2, supercontig 2 n=1 Tax=Podospora anserina (strain S / ATCC MYA-4624 / DSM 980 / FGSC 10383) TaxID=515849 RepID=B2B507_PODAN|nr:uncharacterized protein PODANS_2_3140 [Podospora anserina S mat+]CAP72882.1 unnamed protein product [Podospora anserina S mat+]CDP25282.1 Putative protein of unknown function [Podospora anserina S mat+]
MHPSLRLRAAPLSRLSRRPLLLLPSQQQSSLLSPQSRQPPPLQSRKPQSRPHSRTFLTSLLPPLPTTAPITTLSATKVLPYPPSEIYSLIADINSYHRFLPHCTHSLITSFTPKTNLPKTGDLTVGWGPITQSYTSRVYCIPCTTVEAVSGNASPTIPLDVLRKHGYENTEGDKKGLEGGVFESLCTKWTVREVKGGVTEVKLVVRFRFANPAVGLAVRAVADEMVGRMICAFEGRAREVCGRGGRPQVGVCIGVATLGE